MRNIGTIVGRPREADLCIEIRAIDVHLTASPVHHLAEGADLLFEYAMGGRVRHHDGG